MRTPFAALALILALPLAASGIDPRPVLGSRPDMHARRVKLAPGDPAIGRTGKLVYLGGVALDSGDGGFGGFSSMHLDGDRFTLLSDRGNIVRFRMGADFAPHDVTFGDLPGGPGTGWRKAERDSEAMAVDPATGKTWVAFENAMAIYRYDRALSRVEKHVEPRAMAKWDEDLGPETMVRLSSGRFVVIGEGPVGKQRVRPGLVFAGDPTEHPEPVLRFGYQPPHGYRPTDAAELPDGRLVVVNRRFEFSPELFSAKLTLLDIRGVKHRQLLKGVEIGTLARPLLHDNFEAVAVAQEAGQTILWIASDDNSQFWERSLLLKFRLER